MSDIIDFNKAKKKKENKGKEDRFGDAFYSLFEELFGTDNITEALINELGYDPFHDKDGNIVNTKVTRQKDGSLKVTHSNSNIKPVKTRKKRKTNKK